MSDDAPAASDANPDASPPQSSDDGTTGAASASPRRWLLWSLLGVVVLVVLVALVLVFTRGGPTQYDADTPEGVVQRYVQAAIDGDTDAALEYVVPDIADSCEELGYDVDDVRVTLVKTDVSGTTARVDVIVTDVENSGPLGNGQYDSEEVFRLKSIDGTWLIDSALWQLAVCLELDEFAR